MTKILSAMGLITSSLKTDLVKLAINGTVSTGIFVWLEDNATGLGGLVGVMTILYLLFQITNIIVRWCRKTPKKNK